MIRNARVSDFSAILTLENQVFQIHLNARPDMIKPILPFNKDYFEKILKDENKKVLTFVKGFQKVSLLKLLNPRL